MGTSITTKVTKQKTNIKKINIIFNYKIYIYINITKQL